MKAITPVIATIVLLLITVAIAGSAWTYISGFWSGTVDKQIEVTDAFCVGTNEAKIIVKNIGTGNIRTGDITVLNRSTGVDLTEGSLWNSQVTPPEEGIVADWKFDEGSGTTLKDSAGSHDGTLGNGACLPGAGPCPAWADGKVGSALDFDGNDDYVNMGANGPSLAELAGDKLTITAWIKPGTLAGGGYIFIKNGPFSIYRTGSVFIGRVYISPLSSYVYSTGSIPLTTDWNHVAMTYDGSNVKTFVNGMPDASANVPGGGNIGGDGCPQIGRYNDGSCNNPGWFFQGRIDEIRIYKRVLSPDEIASLAGNVQVEPGGTATLTHVCKGRCSYNMLLGGRSRTASVDCS